MTTPIQLLKNWLNDIEQIKTTEKEVFFIKQEYQQAINLLELNKFK